MRSSVIGGTRTERLGSASSAFSVISRPSASRTGMVLVTSASARPRMVSTWLGSNRPPIKARRSSE